MTGIQAQRNFAARIRQPGVNPLPEGVPVERMAIYEQLFFNTIEGFLSSGFPVSRRLFDEARWRRLVGDFLAGHRCTTPYFPAVGEEFLGWLSDGHCSCCLLNINIFDLDSENNVKGELEFTCRNNQNTCNIYSAGSN